MKLIFSNPCNDNLVRTRTIPTKGTTKKRIDFADSWTWEFMQWDYNYILKYVKGNYTLKVSSGNPKDYLDYSSVKNFKIVE